MAIDMRTTVNLLLDAILILISIYSEPPRGGTGFSYLQTGCHLIGVYRVPQAGLEAWLGVHLSIYCIIRL